MPTFWYQTKEISCMKPLDLADDGHCSTKNLVRLWGSCSSLGARGAPGSCWLRRDVEAGHRRPKRGRTCMIISKRSDSGKKMHAMARPSWHDRAGETEGWCSAWQVSAEMNVIILLLITKSLFEMWESSWFLRKLKFVFCEILSARIILPGLVRGSCVILISQIVFFSLHFLYLSLFSPSPQECSAGEESSSSDFAASSNFALETFQGQKINKTLDVQEGQSFSAHVPPFWIVKRKEHSERHFEGCERIAKVSFLSPDEAFCWWHSIPTRYGNPGKERHHYSSADQTAKEYSVQRTRSEYLTASALVERKGCSF